MLVTVDVFRLSDNVPNSKMSTVTRIAEGRVAILDSHTCLEIQKCRLPICKTSNKMRTCRFLLSFARFCENMSFAAQRC